MKKWGYLLSGILIGAVVATSGSAAAAQVKSLIGQKVTGELTVVVNGKELPSKGAVIDGTTNAPVRALVDAVGGELLLEGKTINITTAEGLTAQSDDNGLQYLLNSKSKLEAKIATVLENINHLKNERIPAIEDQIKETGEPEFYERGLSLRKEELKDSESNLADLQKQLAEIDAKIAELEK